MTHPSPTRTVCFEPECTESYSDNKWGRMGALGWFVKKDGTAWCPAHIPEWVESWRAARK